MPIPAQQVGQVRVHTVAVVSDSAAAQHRSMRPLLQTILLDVAPPLVAYYGLRAAGASEYAALLSATVLSGVRVVYGVVKSRRLDPFAAYLLLTFGLSLAVGLATTDPKLILVGNTLVNGIGALIFLGSCVVGTPLTQVVGDRFDTLAIRRRPRAGAASSTHPRSALGDVGHRTTGRGGCTPRGDREVPGRRRQRRELGDHVAGDRGSRAGHAVVSRRAAATAAPAVTASPDGGNKRDATKVERIRFNFGGLMAEAISVPVLFVSEPIVLPGMVVPIELDDTARIAVDAAQASESGKLLIAPRLDDRYPTYGVIASIVQVGRVAGGGAAAVVRGERRAHIGSGTTGPGAALWVLVDEVAESETDDDTKALAAEYKKLLLALLQRREAWQIVDVVNKITDASALADTAGYGSYLTDVQKRQLLETEDVAERLRSLIDWTSTYLAEVEVNDKIADDVRSGMEKTQKEFLLRQQLAAIRKELGEGEPDGSDDYRARVEAAELPEKVREAAMREVGKLERSSEQSPEGGWIRTWLDTVLDLPWNVSTEDSTDLKSAREILDADHHGLEDVKDRIVEYLAVRARRSQRGMAVVGGRGSGAVMVLAGPPGVGKTSLGESVARALGRKFVRVALGGVRDEAEIRGHRRTYVGALPGRIVRAIGEAGSMNPVVLLDEIDKVGSDYRGDPSAALLEVLDPAQNHTFRDHYLDLDLDLSDVVFLATANVIENIPSALLDRMELVQIDGYTEDDKVAIARDFLLPRQRDRAALTEEEVTVTDAALRKVAADYTREPGVRQFERLLAKAHAEGDHEVGGRPHPVDRRRAGSRWLPWPSALHPGVGGTHGGARCGDRPCRHRTRWRRALHRGQRQRRGAGAEADGSAGRRDEGVRADRALLRAGARRAVGRRPQGAGPPDPRARARGRGAQGRSFGRCHDGDGAGVDGDRAAGSRRRRHDR